MKIQLNIDELVLQGFSRNDAADLDKLIREELTSLIKKEGLPTSLRTGEKRSPQLAGKSFDISRNSNDSKSLGTHIAKSIYRILSTGD